MQRQAKTEDFEKALSKADVRVLLMVLTHLTGDEKWLSDRYHTKRDVRLIPDPGAGLPEAVQQEIRQATANILARWNGSPLISDPGNELMQRMMSVCLGEEVPYEYAEMSREELGFISRIPDWDSESDRTLANKYKILIVGAGVSGISLAVFLTKLQIPYAIVEQASWLGGAWNANRYPGCGVDTPNHAYSYSFGHYFPWSRYFSRREEILNYLEKIVQQYNLLPNIEFNTTVLKSNWDEKQKKWQTTVKNNNNEVREIESNVLVSAIGQLSDPFIPNIEGASHFSGRTFHSSEWPEHLDITGKNVAVIGTGATVMQLAPSIAQKVSNLTIYQRTPQWARPIDKYCNEIPADEKWLLKNVPFYQQWFRLNMFWRYGDGLLPHLRIDPKWPKSEASINKSNDKHRKELMEYISSELRERPDLLDKCTPNYPPYAKRILLDNGWYKMLQERNVELVTNSISKIQYNGIKTSDECERNHDIIVFATGFKLTEMASRLGIVGRNEKELCEAWSDENPTAYLGMTVPGFPNFFSMIGPGSAPAHGGSVIFQAECQSRYISTLLMKAIKQGIGAFEIKEVVHDEYMSKYDKEHSQLIWSHAGTNNYYKNKHGRVFTVSPWRFVDYWEMTHEADANEYHIT